MLRTSWKLCIKFKFSAYVFFAGNSAAHFIGKAPRFNLTYFKPLVDVSYTSISEGWKCRLQTYVPENFVVSFFKAATHFLPNSVVCDGILLKVDVISVVKHLCGLISWTQSFTYLKKYTFEPFVAGFWKFLHEIIPHFRICIDIFQHYMEILL